MKITASNVAIVVLAGGVLTLSAVLLRGDATPRPAPEPVSKADRPKTEKAPIPEIPGALERALRKRIRQLEAELAAARAAAANPTNAPNPAEVHVVEPPAQDRRPDPREWMENLRKNDPKRYEEIRTRFAQMRRRQLERTKGRLDFLGSIDTSGMSKEERANHEKLQDLLVQRENLPEPSEKMTDEEMRAGWEQRRALDKAIREANAAERTALLKQTASSVGLEGEDVTVLTETIQEVIRATDSDRGGRPGPPPPGGGPR